MHHVLSRQLRHHYPGGESIPAEFAKVFAAISDTYDEFDKDRALIERSLDISSRELTKINSDLLAAMKNQQKLERIKTEFLSVTSHELRTPITPMKAQLQMVLQEYFGPLSDMQKKSLGMVLQNTERLDRLIGDILDISKLESGNMRFTFVEADLRAVIDSAVETMKLKAADRNIAVVVQADAVPKFVFDKDRLAQIVINLVNNAIKFTDPGGKITVSLRNVQDHAQISVTDTGIGIAPEDAKRLFHPFVQVDSSLNRNYEGSGLGLAICRGIVESHGGKIWVESTPGKGSTFSFTVPFQHTQRKPVELFSANRDNALQRFSEGLAKQGYEINEQLLEQFLHEITLAENGTLPPDVSLGVLQAKDFIRKKSEMHGG